MGIPLTPVDPDLPTVASPGSPAATAFDPDATPHAELERQVTAYVELGFPALLGLDEPGFRARVAPLADALPASPATPAVPGDGAAFVLVLPGLDVNDTAPAMRRGARLGVSVIDRDEAPTYRPLPGLDLPGVPYLLVDVDSGSELCNVRPEDALVTITGRARTPLTIDEGVAVTAVRPDLLRPNKCFSLLGSRTGTNQRVPAVWISERRAKLGWCWDRNPHTWLGAASAAGRATAG
ncbi:hypothetical protein Cch01nite_37130 [Cellulomonas chitinilytica]|uniref:Uncharacterized protein n=1 Tax=Cellulomonas chitinilytica TaxID=398759 RepID=A0A919U4C1_9CELL|nr:DUF5701 family protein [Cellulomonas chitinilytica]GIG22989.1 hypothetical protein Cch01nite_37130 [Cellulomonas chitinilytica]